MELSSGSICHLAPVMMHVTKIVADLKREALDERT